MAISSPIAIEITDIELYKDNGQRMSLMPQFIEFASYQSLSQPMIQAELTLVDSVGLFYNFPLIGEERIVVTYKPTRETPTTGDEVRTSNQKLQWKFMVNAAQNITPDDKAKSQVYTLQLFSVEMLVNAKSRVQKAFKDSYSNAAKRILKEDLGADATKINDILFQETKGVFQFIVPNLKPLESVAWLAKRSVATTDGEHFFLFWENFNGYNFRTYENILAKGRAGTVPEYFYVSDQDKLATGQLQSAGIQKHQVITAIKTNTRFNTLEKTAFGYFENEYYDIDVFNKRITSTRHKLKPIKDDDIKNYNMNKDEFLTKMQSITDQPGVSPRTHYKISIDGGDYPNAKQSWETKFGPVSKINAAMMQISHTCSLPGDTNIVAGSVIKLTIPEIHGFTNVDKDRYLNGEYIVWSIKHLITVGERHVMVLDLHRPSFEQLISNKIEFDLGE